MKHPSAIPSALSIAYAGRTDTGRRRKKNEDSFLVADGKGATGSMETARLLCAVADGIGGHTAGDVASRMACEGLDSFSGKLTEDSARGLPIETVGESLVEAFFAIDGRIGRLARTEEAFAHMGTTLTSMLFCGDRAVIAHVGDSRIYRMRSNRMDQLTTDHTFVQDLISYGDLTPEQAAVHPFKHMLTAAVGTQEPLEAVQLDTISLAAKDRFLLCTDGLHGTLDPARIAGILGRPDPPARIADMLVEEANAGGGKDNITVVVVFLSSGPPCPRGSERPEESEPDPPR